MTLLGLLSVGVGGIALGNDAANGHKILQPPEAILAFTTVAFSPDARYLVAGTYEGKVLVWSLEQGDLVLSYDTNGTIFDVAFSLDGHYVYSCSASNEVYRVGVFSGEKKPRIPNFFLYFAP